MCTRTNEQFDAVPSCAGLAAAQSGRLSTVQRLLTLAGDQAEQLLAHHDSHGNNALHLAVSQGHTDMASFLLANHSDPNAKTSTATRHSTSPVGNRNS